MWFVVQFLYIFCYSIASGFAVRLVRSNHNSLAEMLLPFFHAGQEDGKIVLTVWVQRFIVCSIDGVYVALYLTMWSSTFPTTCLDRCSYWIWLITTWGEWYGARCKNRKAKRQLSVRSWVFAIGLEDFWFDLVVDYNSLSLLLDLVHGKMSKSNRLDGERLMDKMLLC